LPHKIHFAILLLTQDSSTWLLTLSPEEPCKRLFLVLQQWDLRGQAGIPKVSNFCRQKVSSTTSASS
ncbi:hypothetical protein DV515_00010226, partial [Chloebia gouldiae]